MHLLIVDDEQKILSFLKKLLMREQFTVDTAKNAEQALQKIQSSSYDIIILDVRLPDRNGIELCKDIRRKGINIPVLMLSALDGTTDKINGLNSGADDYLAKPFNFEELLARVHSLCRRQQTFEDIILKTGDLSLNTKNYEVRRGKQSIKLPKKQFLLLYFLLKNKGKIISREQLISYLWGKYSTDSNKLDVIMGRLRKKIDFKKEAKLIETIYRAGYRIKSS